MFKRESTLCWRQVGTRGKGVVASSRLSWHAYRMPRIQGGISQRLRYVVSSCSKVVLCTQQFMILRSPSQDKTNGYIHFAPISFWMQVLPNHELKSIRARYSSAPLHELSNTLLTHVDAYRGFILGKMWIINYCELSENVVSTWMSGIPGEGVTILHFSGIMVRLVRNQKPCGTSKKEKRMVLVHMLHESCGYYAYTQNLLNRISVGIQH